VLVELSVMEQRYQAVLAVVQDGWKVVELARRLVVSRQSVHAWIARYEREGLASLADRSHRLASCPHQTEAETEATICDCAGSTPGGAHAGASTTWPGPGWIPSPPAPPSTAACAATASSNAGAGAAAGEYRRWERDRPMQLWQMDVMGGVELDDGTELKVVTGIDDHSRFCVAAGLVTRAISQAVCQVLAASLHRWGIPDEILTDNGKVFTRRFGPQPVEVLFDRICRENGISHRHTGVRSPTTTGKIERFHQSLRREFLADRTFPSLKAAQAALDAWVTEYNTARPHQALDMATPAERFRLRPLAKGKVSVPVDSREDHRGQWVLRRVGSNGMISVDNQLVSVTQAYNGELVDVFVDGGVLQVWSKNHLIRIVARAREGRVRKVRADGLHVNDQPTTIRKASPGT
jgi:transposase InsO family protein